MKHFILKGLLGMFLSSALVAIAGTAAPAAVPAESPSAGTIPLVVLQREFESIRTGVLFASNKFHNARMDLGKGLCQQTEKNILSAYVNDDLAMLKMPPFLIRFPRVEPNAFGNIKGRIERFSDQLTAADSAALALERALALFVQDELLRKCPDAKKIRQFLKMRDLLKGTEGYEVALKNFARSNTVEVNDPNDIDAPREKKLIDDVRAGVAGSDKKLAEELRKEGLTEEDIAAAIKAIAERNFDEIRRLAKKYPQSKILAQALSDSEPTGPDEKLAEELAKEGLTKGDIAAAIKAIAERNSDEIRRLAKKYPQSKILAKALSESDPIDPNPPESPDNRITDPAMIRKGPISSDTGGNIDEGDVLDPYTVVQKSKGGTGILTKETRIPGFFKKDGAGVAFVRKGEPEVVAWSFVLEKKEENGDFELLDNEAASEHKGFEVQGWTVTEPGKNPKTFPANGTRLDYKMVARGEYRIEAQVKTKLGTKFTIFTRIAYNP